MNHCDTFRILENIQNQEKLEIWKWNTHTTILIEATKKDKLLEYFMHARKFQK